MSEVEDPKLWYEDTNHVFPARTRTGDTRTSSINLNSNHVDKLEDNTYYILCILGRSE